MDTDGAYSSSNSSVEENDFISEAQLRFPGNGHTTTEIRVDIYKAVSTPYTVLLEEHETGMTSIDSAPVHRGVSDDTSYPETKSKNDRSAEHTSTEESDGSGNSYMEHDALLPDEDKKNDKEQKEEEDKATHVESGVQRVPDSRLDRHDWEPIRRIPDEKFKDTVLQFVDLSGDLDHEDVDIVARFEGGYHHVVILRVFDDDIEEDYVIKVPAVGTQSRWRLGDAHNMCSEADLMKYLHEYTDVPVPEVIASEEILDNTLGAPYILMKRIPGVPAYQLWFEDYTQRNHIDAGRISADMEAKRINMLRSLAQAMAQLHTLKFDRIGMPIFTDGSKQTPPRAVHRFRWKHPNSLTPEDLSSDSQIYPYGPFKSSSEYMSTKLDLLWPLDSQTLDILPCEARQMAKGIRKMLDIIFSHPTIVNTKPSTASSNDPETFVLQHPDLDFRNILVDDNGNLTGIIDWDGCMAVPRCVGYASLPEFLRKDWLPEFDLNDSPHMGFQLDHYRQIYTEAMVETGCPEARFTQKSAMYRVIEEVLYSHGDAANLVKKILLEFPSLRRTNLNQFLTLLGRDNWPEAEQWLKIQLEKLLDSGTVSL